MKIAVPAQGNSLHAMMDTRFARAKYFIIFDTETETFEVIDNEKNSAEGGGVGVKVSQDLANKGVEMVIAPHVGPNAEQILKSANIKIVELSGVTVKESMDSVKEKGGAYATGRRYRPKRFGTKNRKRFRLL